MRLNMDSQFSDLASLENKLKMYKKKPGISVNGTVDAPLEQDIIEPPFYRTNGRGTDYEAGNFIHKDTRQAEDTKTAKKIKLLSQDRQFLTTLKAKLQNCETKNYLTTCDG